MDARMNDFFSKGSLKTHPTPATAQQFFRLPYWRKLYCGAEAPAVKVAVLPFLRAAFMSIGSPPNVAVEPLA